MTTVKLHGHPTRSSMTIGRSSMGEFIIDYSDAQKLCPGFKLETAAVELLRYLSPEWRIKGFGNSCAYLEK